MKKRDIQSIVGGGTYHKLQNELIEPIHHKFKLIYGQITRDPKNIDELVSEVVELAHQKSMQKVNKGL